MKSVNAIVLNTAVLLKNKQYVTAYNRKTLKVYWVYCTVYRKHVTVYV